MNPNIEVINPTLWAVRFSWLPWISDISSTLTPIDLISRAASITTSGIMVLNKDDETYPMMLGMMERLQKRSDFELQGSLRYMADKNRDAFDSVYKVMLKGEITRRAAKREFDATHPNSKLPLMHRVMKFLGIERRGGKWVH